MKCQILFSGKNKKNVSDLASAELAQRVVKVNIKLGGLWSSGWKFLSVSTVCH